MSIVDDVLSKLPRRRNTLGLLERFKATPLFQKPIRDPREKSTAVNISRGDIRRDVRESRVQVRPTFLRPNGKGTIADKTETARQDKVLAVKTARMRQLAERLRSPEPRVALVEANNKRKAFERTAPAAAIIKPPKLGVLYTEPVDRALADIYNLSETGNARPVDVPAIPKDAAVIAQMTDDQSGYNPTFPFLKIPVWTKKSGALFAGVTDDAGKLSVPAGGYILHFRAPGIETMPAMDMSKSTPFRVLGTTGTIKKAAIEPDKGRLRVWVEVSSPPLIVMVPIILTSLGIAGWGIGSSLEKVDKVLITSGNTIGKIALAAGIGLAAWYGLPKLFKTKPIGG